LASTFRAPNLQLSLDVRLVVILVLIIIKTLAARRLQIVDPREPVPFDEVLVQPESHDLKII